MFLSLFGASGLSLSAFAQDINWAQGDPATGDVNVADGGKPKLYVDFLGDSTSTYGGSRVATSSPLTATLSPTQTDVSASQSGSKSPTGTWQKYDSSLTPGTVFWVGVGIDKMTAFELSKGGKGLTGLELGFYYNPDYVVPYVGGTTTPVTSYNYNYPSGYKAQIKGANLKSGVGKSSLNQWDEDNYEIVEAVPKMAVESDIPTRELVEKDPTTASILAFNSGWEMLYVSLEKKESFANNTTTNRFSDSGGLNESDICYVMMLPFVLKAHDPSDKICFRLARDASHFSMGGGQYGAGIYASANNETATFGAWERETRTPNHNLKEMFEFEGDLNIFAGANDSDQFYKATLLLYNDNGENGATLFPSDDHTKYVNQGYVDASTPNKTGAALSGLVEGRELTLNVSAQSNYSVGVKVFLTDGTPVSYTVVTAGQQYTFVMPKADVNVTVAFTADLTEADNYMATLILKDTGSKAENTAVLSGAKKDGTTNQTNLTASPVVDTILVAPGNTATVTVTTHPDYRPSVSVETKAGNPVSVTAPTTLSSSLGANNVATNVFTFEMPTADVDVTVTYEKWPTHYAELSVFKDNAAFSAGNKAKLSIQDYSTSVSSPSTRFVELDAFNGEQHVNLENIPENREVKLDITLASTEYLVTEIRLYNKDTDNGTYSSTYQDLLQTPGLQWNGLNGTLSFTMPENSVEVYVVFGKAQNNNAKLVLVDDTTVIPLGSTSTMGTAVMTGNKDGVTGTASAVSNSTNLPAVDTISVWSGNKVDVTITPNQGYRVRSVVITTTNPLQPTLAYTGSANPATGQTNGAIQFTMPDADVTVTVTFEEVARPKYNTTIKYIPANASAYDWLQSGWPDNPNPLPGTNVVMIMPTDDNNYEGDLLTAWVQVKPGWHISGLRLIGLDSSPGGTNTGSGANYPVFSSSGNGYNNGNGGRVVIQLKQPGEDATLQVLLQQGPPTPEPAQGLTLAVDDPDNKTANLARVSIDGAAVLPPAGVNYAYNSGNGYTDSTVTAGQTVDVTWEVASGYYVSDVVVTPASYGVTPTWTAAGAQFQQPAGPATVTVYFTRIDSDNPPYTATLHVTDRGAGESATLQSGNASATPNTTTIDDSHTATPLPAWPGDNFTTTVTANANRYVNVDVFQGGSLVSWTGTDGNGSFVMPAGDVDVYVTFSDTPFTGSTLRLTAYDMTSSTSATGTAGTAKLYFDGTSALTVDGDLYGTAADSNGAPVTVPNVANGRVIKVSAEPKPGYVVDHITYTPNGSVTPVELAAPTGGSGATAWTGRAVTFTMPANALGVEVYFRAGEPTQYTANITIWPPSGATVSDVGDAQFVDTADNMTLLGYSISEPAGTGVRVKAYANDGYYIKRIYITPASLGLASPITGVFATQTVDFLMPAANCIVNIEYEQGWPDSLYANLNVSGPTGVPANNARMTNTSGGSTTNMVTAVSSETLTGIAPGDVLTVKLNKASGYYVETPIQITDSNGVTIPYAWTASDEITFTMPGTWVNVDVEFKAGTDPSDYKATLHLDGGTTGSISHGSTTKNNDGDDIEHLHPGDQITVTGAVNGTATLVVMVFRADDNSVISVTPVTGQPNTYTFVMQEANAEVYIAAVSPADQNEHLAKLIATQDDGLTIGGGSATMTNTSKTPAANTATTVSSISTTPGTVSAGDGHVMEIAATQGSGYVVKSVVVTNDTTGATVPVTQTGANAYTYTMPDDPVTAVVTFKKWDPATDSLTAQIVVNNGGNTGNEATLSKDATTGQTLISNLQPGDQLGIDVTVAPGYKIDLVLISPTTGGAYQVPLVLPDGQSQSVSFYMPSEDVIVHVRFVPDGLTRYNISMDVFDETPSTPNLNNTATIETAFSGVKGPSKHGDPTVTVQGAPTEVVTIKTYPEQGYYAVVTAVLNDGSGTSVSDLTVDPTGTIFTFSAPSSHVKTEVHFYDSSVSPPSHTVTLHIVNSDGVTATTSVFQTSNSTNSTNVDNGTISVPYLDTVSVNALAGTGYLQSAYAEYNGVTLPMITNTDTPNTGAALTARDFTFQMQNGDVDVYVVYTNTPPAGPYTVALTVTGPAGEPVGAAGNAVLKNTVSGGTTTVVNSDEAYTVPDHVVTAAANDTFSVTITPNPGYTLDTVVVSPLSENVLPTSVSQDAATGVWTYTYKMPNPGTNLSVHVKFKASTVTRHTVTLVELTDPDTASPSGNTGKVTYTIYTLDDQGDTMQVPEDQLVTIQVEAGSGYYVHHAYAVTKTGAVLELQNYGPNTVTNLQNLGLASPPAGIAANPGPGATAQFVMPKEDVNVYIAFKPISAPPTGDHSAVVTVNFTSSNGLNTGVKLTNTTLNETTTATVIGETSIPISSNDTNQLKVDWSGTALADGYAVDTLTITYGDGTSTVYTPSATDSTYTFTAPDENVGVIVKLKSAALSTYTATLRIVDHSSAIGNTASMRNGATTVTQDGGTISGLGNGAAIVTRATAVTGVRVAAVTATDSTGTHLLTLNGMQYDYSISGSDVVITVIFDNNNSPTPMYVATVVRTGATAPAGNTAAIANTSNPAVPSGSIWTGIYENNQLRVDVTTDTGYYAVITARKASETAGTASINVLQLGAQGTAASPVVGYLDVPAGINENVVIEVNYTTTPPSTLHDLHLVINDANASTGNTASIQDGTPTFTLSTDGSGTTPVTQNSVVGGTALTLTNTITTGYLKKITLESGGVEITLPLTTGAFTMPMDDATVTVYVEDGARTFRPHDWVQQLSSTADPSYVDGYLIGQNLGSNRIHIQVPNLYDPAESPDTIPAYEEPAHYYEYKLYVKDGSNYTLLSHTGPNPDYDIITYNSYDITSGPNVISGASHTDTGWEFTIRGMKGESALTRILLEGGVLYITATDTTHNYDESEFVEVEIPADPNRGQHKATLRIVDNSGVSGNGAQMSDGTTTVNTSGAVITGLQGSEQIKTQVTVQTGARVSAVTVTDSAGTRLLTELPSDSDRYPYFMTGEDIIITVFFEKDGEDPLTRYIATVLEAGGSGISGNSATIENDTRNDLAKGTIWAEANDGNNMRVTIDLDQGCYATLTAYRTDLGPGSGDIVITAFGGGPGVTQFDAFFTMPASDVQVIVEYTRVSPVDFLKMLTLEVTGGVTSVVNRAALTQTSGSSPITLSASTATPGTTTDTASSVSPGTTFDLWVKPDSGYYVKEVNVYVPMTSVIVTQVLPITAHATNPGEYVGSFTMPLGATKVEVVFEPDNRTGRPYDPDHDHNYNSGYTAGSAADLSDPTQAGWIEAVPQALAAGGEGVIQVTIPALHDDGAVNPALPAALSNAGQATNQPVADYKFYWKDSLGNYHELTVGTGSTDAMTLTNATATSQTVSGGTFTNYSFTLTANQLSGLLDYYIKNGGIIYVTAENTSLSKTKSDYTQIVIPRTYSATLHYSPDKTALPAVDNTARMSDGVQFKTGDGDAITGLKGNETITVDSIAPPSGQVLVGVVGTTASGSANVALSGSSYTWPMTDAVTGKAADVDLTVVYNDSSDPLNSRGPHIVTVKKSGDNGLSGNDASVEDLDVAIPASQKGNIWTAAYVDNVVRVGLSVEPGYYVQSVTAVRRNGANAGSAVEVLTYGNYALLYMVDCDVDVTVTYAQGTAPSHTLTLKVTGTTDGANTAAISFPTAVPAIATLNASGTSTSNTQSGVPADTALDLTTALQSGWSVEWVKLTVDGTSLSVDIPLIDGEALPGFAMPYADATVTVKIRNGALTPRPYEPNHSTQYNAADYPSVVPDYSRTHMEGWILVDVDGATDEFTIPVRTLHDALGLHDGDLATYTLYWKDEMGNFQSFTVGGAVTNDITMTQTVLSSSDGAAYEDPANTKYNGALLTVKVNHSTSPTLWGGYKLMEYLQNGGSIYITATESAGMESEKTEVVLRVVPTTYKATLRYTPNGSAAIMTDSAGLGTVNIDGDSITGLEGTEVITVSNITKPTGYTVVGVVATTASGSKNAVQNGSQYTYTMDHEDVTMQVVYRRDDDILQPKGPRIVTVYKVDDDGEVNNGASVTDLDVAIPADQKGTIWTAAYADNVVRVNVTTKTGYYAVISAEKRNGVTGTVEVTTFATYDGTDFTDFYGLFYMPAGCDVDVTVTYHEKTTEDYEYDLTLELKDHDDLTGNSATITFPDASTLSLAGSGTTANTSAPALTDTKSGVLTGSELKLKTTVAEHYRVKSAVMTVGTTTIDIPLTDREVLPVPVMPFANAKITVTMEQKPGVGKAQMPRPYDPTRSEAGSYNISYHHKNDPSSDPADESRTHQDGWIKAVVTGANTISIPVPVLHDRFDGTSDKLHSAYTDTDVLTTYTTKSPRYNLYWRDELGNFHGFTVGAASTYDIQLDAKAQGSYTHNSNSYNSAVLEITINTKNNGTQDVPTIWGGYKLLEYIRAGGSIYVSAVDPNSYLGESEYTEVVIEGASVRPYDPDHTGSSFYKEHWIRAENRGDYLYVTVPVLNNDAGSNATNVDDSKHRLQIFLQKDATKVDDDKNVTSVTDMVNVTSLLTIQNVRDFQITGSGELNADYDADWRSATGYTTHTYDSKYENDEYWEDPNTHTKYQGARFVISLAAEPATGTLDHDNWVLLKNVIDNEGTMSTAAGATARRLYITADNEPTGTAALSAPTDLKLTDFVDLEVPRYYTWQGILESYGPRHPAYFELYRPGATASDPDVLVHTFTIGARGGRGLWQQDFAFKSSELKGSNKWILRITKPGHVTWKQELILDMVDDSTATDGSELTFTMARRDGTGVVVMDGAKPEVGVIALFGGDIDQDGIVGLRDREMILRYADDCDYTDEKVLTTTNATDWAKSVYNEESTAYAADLDGDRRITVLDLAALMEERNFGMSHENYTDPVFPWKSTTTNLTMLSVGMAQPMSLEGLVPDPSDRLLELADQILSEYTDAQLAAFTDEDVDNLVARMVAEYESEIAAESLATAPEVVDAPIVMTAVPLVVTTSEVEVVTPLLMSGEEMEPAAGGEESLDAESEADQSADASSAETPETAGIEAETAPVPASATEEFDLLALAREILLDRISQRLAGYIPDPGTTTDPYAITNDAQLIIGPDAGAGSEKTEGETGPSNDAYSLGADTQIIETRSTATDGSATEPPAETAGMTDSENPDIDATYAISADSVLLLSTTEDAIGAGRGVNIQTSGGGSGPQDIPNSGTG